MDDAALRSWVSDQLFALLGFAESALVAFVIALGALPQPPAAQPPLPPRAAGARSVIEAASRLAWLGRRRSRA
jgi:hypothetical protein